MAGPAVSIELTASEVRQLTAWLRAGTTPHRLVRRARLILGGATGLGSRALAQREQMSRTTARRWLARLVPKRCDGLYDRPRSGRGAGVRNAAERDVPLRRYSLSELSLEMTGRLGAELVIPSRTRYRCWIFPRDPHFLERAGLVLDLYACHWQGQPLWADEYVLSADEKTSIQVRRRRYPTSPPGPHQATRVEHEYERAGVLQYLAAWDVHRAVVFGRCEPRTGKAAFGRLVDDVMRQEPIPLGTPRVLDRRQRPSHRGERSAEELRARHPRIVIVHTPTYASWLNQIEIYFSIIQRKVLTPNDYTSLDQLAESITAFGQRYSALEMPFNWRFTRHDLERRLRDPLLQPELIALATAA
jgi:hypothetical protein